MGGAVEWKGGLIEYLGFLAYGSHCVQWENFLSFNTKKQDMKSYKHLATVFFITVMILLFTLRTHAQVVVNEKNLNDEKDLNYIQLMYTIDKNSLKPVFYVDFGFIEPEYNEILKPEKDFRIQKISINGEAVNDRVTVVWVLNKMHQAGWEYLGDAVYVPIPMMDNWHIFTLRKK